MSELPRPAISRTELRHQVLAQACRYEYLPRLTKEGAIRHKSGSWPSGVEVRTLRWLLEHRLVTWDLGKRLLAARCGKHTPLGEQTLAEWNADFGPAPS